MTITPFHIGARQIGADHPTYIVAEISANHQGDFEGVVELVHAIKAAGADAVKLQTYTADTLTIPCEREFFQIGGGTLWDGRTLYDLYQEAAMPWEWQPKLKAIADEIELACFSTAFDATAVEFLDRMDVPIHKIASFELVDHPLIQTMARTGKPLILSTGMATLDEIRESVDVARSAGARELMLLKCTSAYPAPPSEMHLRAIDILQQTFGVPVGLSDHTLGVAIPIAAVAIGAVLVEKHVTMSRQITGPDSSFSLEPAELKHMVESIRAAEQALADGEFAVEGRETAHRHFRRSLFVVRAMKSGERFTSETVRSIRPHDGLAPKYLTQILGSVATCDISMGTPLTWEMVKR